MGSQKPVVDRNIQLDYYLYMVRVNCQNCDKEFYVKPNRILRGWGKYCSKTCQHIGAKNGKTLACLICGKEVYRSLKDQGRSKSNKFFCSKSCQTIWRNSEIFIGKKHANWKTGEYSYRDALKRAPVLPYCLKCNTNDTRVLAVHHKDRNRSNNNISNLIWLCHNCHYLVHHYKNEATAFVVA